MKDHRLDELKKKSNQKRIVEIFVGITALIASILFFIPNGGIPSWLIGEPKNEFHKASIFLVRFWGAVIFMFISFTNLLPLHRKK